MPTHKPKWHRWHLHMQIQNESTRWTIQRLNAKDWWKGRCPIPDENGNLTNRMESYKLTLITIALKAQAWMALMKSISMKYNSYHYTTGNANMNQTIQSLYRTTSTCCFQHTQPLIHMPQPSNYHPTSPMILLPAPSKPTTTPLQMGKVDSLSGLTSLGCFSFSDLNNLTMFGLRWEECDDVAMRWQSVILQC